MHINVGHMHINVGSGLQMHINVGQRNKTYIMTGLECVTAERNGLIGDRVL